MTTSIKKKILIVAESIDVEDSSGSKANVALILNLHDAGFNVLVYHYTRKDINLPGINCVAIKERKFHPFYLFSRVQRKIQNGLKINLAKFLEPLFGFSFTYFNDTASIAAGLQRIKDFRPDIVMTVSKGASYRPHYAMLQMPVFHKIWLAYLHDPYPFHYYPEPYNWSEPGYKNKIRFFKRVSEKCRWVAYPSTLLKEWMELYYPGFSEKSIIMPHQVRVEKEKIETPNYFDPKKFNLLHAGNLMKQRPPFGLIEGFQNFLLKNPEAKAYCRLLLLGNASDHLDGLKNYIDQEGQIYSSEGYVEYDLVLNMQKKASVNIILESKAALSPFLPGKFSHCIEAGKIILLLGPENSEVRRLMGMDYPYWAEIDEVEKIAFLIEALYAIWRNNPNDLQMEREDLKFYLSEKFLKAQILKILAGNV